jgi:hypothetical protein
MKSELFVINAIKTSDQAFAAVAEHVPRRDVSTLLKALRNARSLQKEAMNMQVNYNQVFEHLEQAIAEAFSRRTIPKLTKEHVRMLLNADVQRLLAVVLDCSPQEALHNLFSIQHLQATLDYLSGGRALWLVTAAQLLREMLKPSYAQTLQLDYFANENDWSPIFEEEQWLSPVSAKKLVESGKVKNAKTPYQALAELVDIVRDEQESAIGGKIRDPNTIDAFGLLELRRRLFWIISSLHDQALENAGNAPRRVPTSQSLQLLQPILYMYELGYIARGLETYINYTHTLHELLPEGSYAGYEVDQDKVIPDRPLIFSELSPPHTVENIKVATFEIKCEMRGQGPQRVLEAHDVPEWVHRQLQRDVPKLTPNDLKIGFQHLFHQIAEQDGSEEDTGFLGRMAQLYRRLLFTSFPVLEQPVQLLKEAVGRLGAEFVQAVALSCESPIAQIPKLWQDSLEHRLPYEDLPAKRDPLYSEGVEQIITRHQRHCDRSYSTLQIIRGIDFPDSDEAA